MEDNKPEEKEESVWGYIITLVIIAAIGFVFFWAIGQRPNNAETALASYKSAVNLCGATNVDEHDYDNGTKDFDCQDYSIVK